MKKLLVIDTYGLIFRAYHALPSELRTKSGVPTNAIYGFIQMLISLMDQHLPTNILCALESKTKTFRHEILSTYKSNRKEADPELKEQISKVIELIEILNIPAFYVDGYEADDVIGSFVSQHEDQFDEIRIFTGDRDLLQLITSKIHVIMPGFSFSSTKEYDYNEFKNKYHIEKEDFILYKSLIGDPSDNIKGIPGVGPKTAEKIVKEFHTVDSLLANLDQLPERTALSIQENSELLKDYYRLSRIETDIQMDIKADKTKMNGINVRKLRDVVQMYELTSLGKKVARFIDKFEQVYGGVGLFGDERVKKIEYKIIDKVEFNEISDL